MGSTVLQPLPSTSPMSVQTGGDSLADLVSEIRLGQQQLKFMVRQEYGPELNGAEQSVEEMEALLISYGLTTEEWLDGFNLGMEMLMSAMDAHRREAATATATDTIEPALWEEIRADEIFVLTRLGYCGGRDNRNQLTYESDSP